MTGNKILIIEDNELNLELATDLLEVNGFVVAPARTAEEGNSNPWLMKTSARRRSAAKVRGSYSLGVKGSPFSAEAPGALRVTSCFDASLRHSSTARIPGPAISAPTWSAQW